MDVILSEAGAAETAALPHKRVGGASRPAAGLRYANLNKGAP